MCALSVKLLVSRIRQGVCVCVCSVFVTRLLKGACVCVLLSKFLVK